MEITQELLHELFEYRDGVLYWKVSNNRRIKVGDAAGSFSRTAGYLQTQTNEKSYLNHRLIFLMHHGYLPKYVDHIDGNPLNNRIENLREATQQQNCFNQKLRKNNNSGVKNVYWEKHARKWRVRLTLEGRHKHFGYYDDLELAELVAEEARNKYHGEYTNHGKKNEKDIA